MLAPLALACYVLLLLYGLKTLDNQPFRPWANSPSWHARRARPPRQLLVLLLLGFGLGLSFVALDAWFGPFTYSEIWFAFGVRCALVFGLAVVGLQASYVATPLPTTLASAWPAGAGALARPAVATAAAVAKDMVAETPHPPAVLPPELLPWRDKLLVLMADERPWLEPELTLAELAQRLRLHPAQLSKVVNLGCGQNFSDFVNRYRVAEAQRKLADPRFAHYSLVGVALESGFNSKSTFNRVFRKLAGQAPREVARPKL